MRRGRTRVLDLGRWRFVHEPPGKKSYLIFVIRIWRAPGFEIRAWRLHLLVFRRSAALTKETKDD